VVDGGVDTIVTHGIELLRSRFASLCDHTCVKEQSEIAVLEHTCNMSNSVGDNSYAY
jgi:hypothetical protein